VDILGASLESSATLDASFVSLTVLKRNLPPAFALLGDAVVRPRFDAKEWKRVQDLWVNALMARAQDPEAVSQVVARSALFGKESPYGHPITGVVRSAQKTTLDEASRFYKAAWRPDRATVVAVGDVTQAELAPLLDTAFSNWKAPASPAAIPPSPAEPKGPAPRFILVDRPDAPQSVIALVRAGVAVSNPAAAPLSRVNSALGGSFTSRLNQDLREEHGWSYGASSRVAFARGVGSITASSAVFTEKTGDALRALIADVETYAKGGLTDDEVDKTRSQARAELVEVYEQVDNAAFRLATNATCGLAPDHETQAAVRRDAATRSELSRFAAKFFDPAPATILVVGPKEKIISQIKGLGLPEPEIRDEEGNVKQSSAEK
jgi:zinc protease